MTKTIEFTGMPEAGKTTTIYNLVEKFKNSKIIDEASTKMKKILKEDATHKALYIVVSTIKEYIEAINEDFDYIFIDRGLYDREFWNEYSYTRGDITLEEKEERESFIKQKHFKYKADLLVVFSVDVEEALKRRGGEGRFVTREKLNFYKQVSDDFFKTFTKTKIFQINTTNKTKEEVTNEVEKAIKNI